MIRSHCKALADNARFGRVIIAIIIINAVTLGLESIPLIADSIGGWLYLLDRTALAIFVFEIGIRLIGYGWRFFRDPWNVFDFVIVGLALIPATDAFSVLRALRVLRVLRLISVVPRMRRVIEALLTSLPGLGAVVALLLLIFYVAGVMATQLFGDTFPQWFGNLGSSIYSLFQIMTLESWSMGIVRPVMEAFPYAWAFFVPFILVATFTILNLFIAVVVNAMQTRYHEEEAALAQAAHNEREALLEEIKLLRKEVRNLSTKLATGDD